MKKKTEKIKRLKKFFLVFLIGCASSMISACALYDNHTSLLMDYPSQSPYPYAYYDNYYGYGPYDYPPAYYGGPYFYGGYDGGYNGSYYNGAYGGSAYGSPSPSMPGHRMLR